MEIYISSPVSHYQRAWNLEVTDVLRQAGATVYLPQEITQPRQSHKTFDYFVYDKCVEWIDASDIGVLLLPYGRDCAWEVGYYRGLNKPLIVIVDKLTKDNQDRLRDWMIKGSVDGVVCLSDHIAKQMSQDPILALKPHHTISSLAELPALLEEILSGYNAQPTHYLGAGAIVMRGDKVLLVQEKTDSHYYNRKKGMWGFPTKMVTHKDPKAHAVEALQDEAGLAGKKLSFVSMQNIPRATGIFYTAHVAQNQKTSKGRWTSIDAILKGEVYIRPTFDAVLKQALAL